MTIIIASQKYANNSKGKAYWLQTAHSSSTNVYVFLRIVMRLCVLLRVLPVFCIMYSFYCSLHLCAIDTR